MSVIEQAPNVEQLRAIEEPGVVFVSAGAGTGPVRYFSLNARIRSL